MIKLPERKESKYKKLLKTKGIKLWQVSQLAGIDESLLSRQLNGIRPLSKEVEDILKEVTK